MTLRLRPLLTLFLAVNVLAATSLLAQLTPAQAVAEMGRGINLGNTLEPPLEGAWNNGPAEERYFDAYVEAGFTNVRVPVRWDEHTQRTPPYAVDAAWMNRVEQVVDWGLARGLYVVLNGHHEDWLKQNYRDTTLQARYDSIWAQVVRRFNTKSDHLLYEVINEPNGMSVAQVDDLNARTLAIVRATEPTRLVIFGGNVYANAEQLLTAAIPDDDYLVGYYHSYDPWEFAGMARGTWGTPADYAAVTRKFDAVAAWSQANGIPVHLSEFGARVSSDYNSRMRFYAHYVEEAERTGFAWSAWDDGGDFRILEREGETRWPELKDVLGHYHGDSPTDISSALTVDTVSRDSTIVLTWTNRTTSAADIVVERAASSYGDFEPLVTLPAGDSTFVDTALTGGGTFLYRLYTRRDDGTLLHGYPTRVFLPSGTQAPYGGAPIPLPGKLEVENYDLGGEGLGYHDGDAYNDGGAYRLGEGVDIGGSPEDGYTLGYVSRGEWLEFAVDVAEAGTYTVAASAASEQANGTFELRFARNDAAVMFTTPATGGWNDYRPLAADNEVALEAGVQQVRLTITGDAAFNLDWVEFTLKSVAVEDLADAAGFRAYPNPVREVLTVTLPQNTGAAADRLRLVSVTGQVVREVAAQSGVQPLDVRGLAPGVYVLQLRTAERQLARRVVVAE